MSEEKKNQHQRSGDQQIYYASEDLARELFQLSGWKGDVETSYTPSAPHYTLGGLLRKLPHQIEGEIYKFKLEAIGLSWSNTQDCWKADYGFGTAVTSQYADLPEDALCKLAIELFKQNILTKRADHESP